VLSLGEFLWSLLVIFFMTVYFMMLFYVIVDVFRRDDASGWKKAAWLVFLFVAPLVSLLAYTVTNGNGMAARTASRRLGYYGAPTDGDAVAEIAQAKGLLDSGAISEEEYARLKEHALSY
jgi:hypothetical protein